MNSKTGGRALIATALIVVIATMFSTFGRDLISRARTGVALVRSRNVELEVTRDVTYRTVAGTALKLDVYRPHARAGLLPGLLLIHGGSWRSGTKEQMNELAKPLAQNGFVVVNINYRLAPQFVFPAQTEDAKAAVRWMRRHAAQYGINAKHIGVVGASAGAQMAAMLGTAGETDYMTADKNDVSSRVQAVIAVSGPFDFYRFDSKPDASGLAYWLGGSYRQKPEAYRAASPILHVSNACPPYLLIDGAQDELVLPKNDDLMADVLKKSGVEVNVIRVQNAGHVLAPIDDKNKPDPPYAVVLLQAVDFLNRHLK